MSRARFLPFLLVPLVVASGCAGLRYAAYQRLTSAGRIERKEVRAYRAKEAGDFETARKLYGELRAKVPGDFSYPREEAVAACRLGNTEEAWSLLDSAVKAGLRWPIDDEPGLEALHADPRWESVRERIVANFHAYGGRLAASKREIPADGEPSFRTYANLKVSVDDDRTRAWKYRRYDRTGDGALRANEVDGHALAKIRRYLDEHPDAADREEAMRAEIELRLVRADPYWSEWGEGESRELADAARRYLAAFPNSEYREVARLHETVAVIRGVLPDTGWELGRKEPYAPNCEPALPVLEQLSSDAKSDTVRAQALGFVSYCGWYETPRREDLAKSAAARFLALDEASFEAFAYPRLPAEVRKIRLLSGDLPPFEIRDLADTTWTPKSLEGRVTILQFWSPG